MREGPPSGGHCAGISGCHRDLHPETLSPHTARSFARRPAAVVSGRTPLSTRGSSGQLAGQEGERSRILALPSSLSRSPPERSRQTPKIGSPGPVLRAECAADGKYKRVPCGGARPGEALPGLRACYVEVGRSGRLPGSPLGLAHGSAPRNASPASARGSCRLRTTATVALEPSDSVEREEWARFVVRCFLRIVLIVGLLGCSGADSEVARPDASATAGSQVAARQPGSRFDPSGFPEAPGQELAIVHCTACHSGRLVQQNRATRHGWSEMIRWMQAKQGLWPLSPEVESRLLDYLTAHYGPDRESGARRRLPLPAALMPPVELDSPAPI